MTIAVQAQGSQGFQGCEVRIPEQAQGPQGFQGCEVTIPVQAQGSQGSQGFLTLQQNRPGDPQTVPPSHTVRWQLAVGAQQTKR